MKRILTIVACTLLLSSCTPTQNEEFSIDNTDLVIIEVNNLEEYTYTDLGNIGDDHEYRENGDLYTYHTSGNILHVSTSRNIDRVQLLINHAPDKNIEFKQNKFSIDTSGEEYIRFRVYYTPKTE